MVFSSTVFLFLFLPVVLTGHLLLPRPFRNTWLLLASLLFYAWGEPGFTLVMLASIGANYLLGLLVDRYRGRPSAVIAVTVAFNIGLLAVFKYANFAVEIGNQVRALLGLAPVAMRHVPLPIGISFFTFHAISYVVDVYRRDTPLQRNPFRVALYVSLFPQLVAGPIVRYRDVAEQIERRRVTIERFAYGVSRFTMGLAKKVLVANTVAVPADRIFGLPAGDLHPSIAWAGVTCYTLQIYFDFSGYSDMAIGLGEMFGFHFRENFQYPYIARSVKDFWRRWHISLSTWLRDYLYISLGGSHRGTARTYVNLVTVFFLCGLWHGASWNFVTWGLYHGAFLVLERTRAGAALDAMPRALRHAYTMLVVMVGWVVFRAETLPAAGAMLRAMLLSGDGAPHAYPVRAFLANDVAIALLAGIIGSAPVLPAIGERLGRALDGRRGVAWTALRLTQTAATVGGVVVLFVLCAMALSAQTHNPFIYYRF